MYAKLLAAAAGLILSSVVALAGDNTNCRIPDHQPRQTGTDPDQPKTSADRSRVETLGREGKAESLGAWGVQPGGEKPQPDSC